MHFHLFQVVLKAFKLNNLSYNLSNLPLKLLICKQNISFQRKHELNTWKRNTFLQKRVFLDQNFIKSLQTSEFIKFSKIRDIIMSNADHLYIRKLR